MKQVCGQPLHCIMVNHNMFPTKRFQITSVCHTGTPLCQASAMHKCPSPFMPGYCNVQLCNMPKLVWQAQTSALGWTSHWNQNKQCRMNEGSFTIQKCTPTACCGISLAEVTLEVTRQSWSPQLSRAYVHILLQFAQVHRQPEVCIWLTSASLASLISC